MQRSSLEKSTFQDCACAVYASLAAPPTAIHGGAVWPQPGQVMAAPILALR
jgi:hypothetical protein